jgi:hypothetical protein
MDAEIEAAQPQQVVYLPPPWTNMQYVFPVAGVIFAALILWSFLSASPAPDGLTLVVAIVIALFFLSLCLAVAIGIRQVRLVITPAGIVYHNLGYRIVAPWANVTGVGVITSGSASYDGLLLARSGTEADAWLSAGIKAAPLLALIGAFTGRFVTRAGSLDDLSNGIPVGLFDPTWQDDALGATIRRYAPHAFAPAATPPSSPPA